MDQYKTFIVNYLGEYPDTPASIVHDKLKECFCDFPELDPKTVYNYVVKIRGEFNIPKVARSNRQYTAVPDLPMGQQAQVDFGMKRFMQSADF